MTRRILPHNLDAEASILGGILLRNQVLAEVPELEVDDFYDHKHKVVFQAIRNLEATARPIDVVTLEVEIEKLGKLEALLADGDVFIAVGSDHVVFGHGLVDMLRDDHYDVRRVRE